MKFTAKMVHKRASRLARDGYYESAEMLRELASRLRQEEEAKRDCVKDPKPGDRIEYPNNAPMVFVGGAFLVDSTRWEIECKRHGAIIIPRREVPT